VSRRHVPATFLHYDSQRSLIDFGVSKAGLFLEMLTKGAGTILMEHIGLQNGTKHFSQMKPFSLHRVSWAWFRRGPERYRALTRRSYCFKVPTDKCLRRWAARSCILEDMGATTSLSINAEIDKEVES